MPVHEALRPFMRYCVVKTLEHGAPKPLEHDTYADLWPSLVILKGPGIRMRSAGGVVTEVPRASFMGAARVPSSFIVPDGAQVIGFNFAPGKAHPFFESSLEQFSDRIVTLEEAWGAEGRELAERLEAAATPRQVKALVDAAFLRRLGRFKGFPDALPEPVQTALDSKGGTSVGELAAQAGVSERHLKRLFDQWVGLSPKLFSRITRFQALCDGLTPASEPDWAELAFDHGYFDQSHLIRDFTEFAGVSPTAFFAAMRDPVGGAGWTAMQPAGMTPSL